jgi:hypothetical protein
MAIKFFTTSVNPPEAGREIIAKNPLKPIGYGLSAKQCKIMKFHRSFPEDKIVEFMLNENLTLWSYTE